MFIYLIYLLVLSFITFVFYGIDKRKAKKQKYRISESTLLLLSIFGGALGGLIAMNKFRHKTKHWYFKFINVTFLIIHIVLIYFIYKQFGL